MENGTKKKGDQVKVGDILFSYETDKASFEEEAKEEGVLLEIFFAEGDEVAVLENVAVIGKAGEPVDEFRPGGSSKPAMAPVEEKNETAKEAAVEKPAVAMRESSDEAVKISPRAKKQAEAKGVDYNQLQGSGPRGRIIERDVVTAAETMPVMTSLAKAKASDEQLRVGAEVTGMGGRGAGQRSRFDQSGLQCRFRSEKTDQYSQADCQSNARLVAKFGSAHPPHECRCTHHHGSAQKAEKRI